MVALIVSAFILVLAALVLMKQPLSRRFGVSNLWDVGVGTVVIMTVIFYLISNFVAQQIIEDDLAKQPCGVNSPQGRCYTLNRELCESLWAKADQECKAELADFLKLHPTSLVGPAASRCIARQMDKAIRFNRINADTPYCRAYFKFIEKQPR